MSLYMIRKPVFTNNLRIVELQWIEICRSTPLYSRKLRWQGSLEYIAYLLHYGS